MGLDCRNILVPTGFKPPRFLHSNKAPKLQTPDSRLSDLQAVPATWTRFPTVMRIPPPPNGHNTHIAAQQQQHMHTRPDHTRPHHSVDNMTLPQPSGPLTDCISLESSLGLDRSCAWACNQHPSAIKSCHLVDPFSIPRCSNVTSPSFALYTLQNRIPRYHPASRNTSCRAQVVQGSFFRPGRPSRTLLTT